jgi:hypothetical protein
MKEKKTWMGCRISEGLGIILKIHCVTKKISMQQFIEEAIKEKLNFPKKGENEKK